MSIPRKQCGGCKRAKPLTEFYADRRRKDGKRSSCKECSNAAVYRYRAKDPVAYRERQESYQLKRRYGIDRGDYQELLYAQGGVCAICGGEPKVRTRLSVDHCHRTGRVRGLLCTHCNTALGSFMDDPLIVQAALHYLLNA